MEQKNSDSTWMRGVGAILALIQILIYVFKGWNFFQNVTGLAVFLYELMFFLGYSFIGVIGVLLLVLGIIKERQDINDIQSDNKEEQ